MAEETKQSFTSMAAARLAAMSSRLGSACWGSLHGQGIPMPSRRSLHDVSAACAAAPVRICGRNQEAVEEAARRYGFETAWTDWRKFLDETAGKYRYSITAPERSACRAIAPAASHGMHVVCETVARS
jgi:predicted dehydrogenase